MNLRTLARNDDTANRYNVPPDRGLPGQNNGISNGNDAAVNRPQNGHLAADGNHVVHACPTLDRDILSDLENVGTPPPKHG